MDDELVFDVPQEEKKPVRKEKVDVRRWLVIDGLVLLESNGDFRLEIESEWPDVKTMSIYKLDFEALDKPHEFNIGGIDNELFWKAGIVRRGTLVPLAALQQVLHYSQAKYSPEDLIQMLKV